MMLTYIYIYIRKKANKLLFNETCIKIYFIRYCEGGIKFSLFINLYVTLDMWISRSMLIIFN